MSWLIWKEYRQNRLILIVAAVLLVVPYAVALLLAWYNAGPGPERDGSHLTTNLVGAAIYAVAICQLVLALLGGNAIAGERADRSAEFVAYLPLSRARILAAKIALAVLATAVIWVPNLLVLLVLTAGIPDAKWVELFTAGWLLFGTIATTGFAFYGVAWLFSSLLDSPTFSVCAGLVTLQLIAIGLLTWAWLFDYHAGQIVVACYRWICLLVGAACFAAGSWYYLRRVEP